MPIDTTGSPSKFLNSAYKGKNIIYIDQDLRSGRNRAFSILKTSKLKVGGIEV